MTPERKVWKVFFADDEEGIRKVMEITLEDAGYQVLTAPDGETAIVTLRKGITANHDHRYPYAQHK